MKNIGDKVTKMQRGKEIKKDIRLYIPGIFDRNKSDKRLVKQIAGFRLSYPLFILRFSRLNCCQLAQYLID